MHEVTTLLKIKQEAEKPIVLVLGDKKEDKLKFIEPLSNWADQILVGGLLPKVIGKEGQTEGKTIYASLTTDAKDITLESAAWNGTMDLFEDRHNQAGTRSSASS